jgi:hypothetical protein
MKALTPLILWVILFVLLVAALVHFVPYRSGFVSGLHPWFRVICIYAAAFIAMVIVMLVIPSLKP